MTERPTSTPVLDEAELRQRAVKRLEDKRGLVAHSLAYVSVNLLLVAIWFVTGAVGAFVAFPLLARLVMALARLAGRPRSAVLRLALANIHRPGAPTPTVMLSLGLGLTVMVATALIEGNLQNQIGQRIPKDAPAFFVVDLQPDQLEPRRLS